MCFGEEVWIYETNCILRILVILLFVSQLAIPLVSLLPFVLECAHTFTISLSHIITDVYSTCTSLVVVVVSVLLLLLVFLEESLFYFTSKMVNFELFFGQLLLRFYLTHRHNHTEGVWDTTEKHLLFTKSLSISIGWFCWRDRCKPTFALFFVDFFKFFEMLANKATPSRLVHYVNCVGFSPKQNGSNLAVLWILLLLRIMIGHTHILTQYLW